MRSLQEIAHGSASVKLSDLRIGRSLSESEPSNRQQPNVGLLREKGGGHVQKVNIVAFVGRLEQRSLTWSNLQLLQAGSRQQRARRIARCCNNKLTSVFTSLPKRLLLLSRRSRRENTLRCNLEVC